MRITVAKRRLVEECAAKPRRRSAEEDSEVDADSSSDAEVIDTVLGTGKVVDTDDERSAGSLDSSSSSGDDPFIDEYIIPKPLKAATGAPATGGGATTGAGAATGATKPRRAGVEPLWSDPYFSVWGHPNLPFLRLVVRDLWRQPPPRGMGTATLSKQVTPKQYGEQCDDPVRSLLLLRAWALWRARQGGWATAQRGRARHFREQEVLLEREVRSLQAKCKLLGNRKANAVLSEWAPDVVQRLLA